MLILNLLGAIIWLAAGVIKALLLIIWIGIRLLAALLQALVIGILAFLWIAGPAGMRNKLGLLIRLSFGERLGDIEEEEARVRRLELAVKVQAHKHARRQEAAPPKQLALIEF